MDESKIQFDLERIADLKRGFDNIEACAKALLAALDKERVHDLIIYPEYLTVEVKTFEQLTYVRSMFKKLFGKWTDQLSHVFNTFADQAIAHYECTVNDEGFKAKVCKIWFLSTIQDFPDELTGNKGCKFEKVTKEEWRLVCPTNTEGGDVE